MKKLFTLLAITFTLITTAQAPQGFNYQATVRNVSGQLLLNEVVLVKFNVLQNSAIGTVVYSENQTANTDELGHINLVVGQGTPTKGTFTTINWSSGTYYLGIELNTGLGYVEMGTTQLLSVPYALYANSAGNSQVATPTLGSVLAVSNSANNTKITNLQNPTNAQDAATKSYTDTQLQTQIGTLQTQIGTLQTQNSTLQTQNSSLQAQITALQAQINAGQVAYPVLTTTAITAITATTATAGGNVTSDGNANITARGVCWSTTANPTIALTTKTVNGTGTGSFTIAITGLTANTTYYVRAFATNSFGTSYGDQVSFTTLTSNIAPLPNVTIGTQIWQSTNLDVTTYRDGTPIPQVTDPKQWVSLTTGAWCYYNNDPAKGNTYGKLYNWYAVAGIHDTDPSTPNKTLAPTGWHVPSDAEWTNLTRFLGGYEVAGGKMKATGTSLWDTPNQDATNSSGFTGLPGGLRFEDGPFGYIGSFGFWWSTSETEFTGFHSSYNLYYDTGISKSGGGGKIGGLSVRCLRD